MLIFIRTQDTSIFLYFLVHSTKLNKLTNRLKCFIAVGGFMLLPNSKQHLHLSYQPSEGIKIINCVIVTGIRERMLSYYRLVTREGKKHETNYDSTNMSCHHKTGQGQIKNHSTTSTAQPSTIEHNTNSHSTFTTTYTKYDFNSEHAVFCGGYLFWAAWCLIPSLIQCTCLKFQLNVMHVVRYGGGV